MDLWPEPAKRIHGGIMTLSRNNGICGLVVIALGAVLLSQSSLSENALVSEGIHPMDYPRFLIFLLCALGVFIVFGIGSAPEKKGIPIVTRRTVSMCGCFILFALLFNTVGFAVSSTLATVLCALVMGYRRYGMLLAVSAFGNGCVWMLFTYALKIPLPTGTLW